MTSPVSSQWMHAWIRALRCAVVVGALAVGGGLARGECPEWIPTFGGQPGVDGLVSAFVEFDDGTGPALYVGGGFRSAGGVEANSIAKWDGRSWSALGSGIEGRYGEGRVNALSAFDDGTGPALYAGGEFTMAGGEEAVGIARWKNGAWSAIASEFKAEYDLPKVHAIAVLDNGGEPSLYVAGYFSTIDGVEAPSIAKWDGRDWSSLSSDTQPVSVSALAVFDDGGGSALYAAGTFWLADGTYTRDVMKWDGDSWSPLGFGLSNGTFADLNALTVFDDGGGPVLCVGGYFTSAGGVEANSIARWDGVSWSGFGSGFGTSFTTGSVYALASFDDGSGPALYAGGFRIAGRVAKWDGDSWTALGGSGVTGPNDPFVAALGVFKNGSVNQLLVGGRFSAAAGYPALSVAAFDGHEWSSLGNGLSGVVHAIAEFNDGDGSALYVTGQFSGAGGIATNNIAKWDGEQWTALGGGIVGAGGRALCVFDDGAGPALFVGGWFLTAGGTPAKYVAKWDGASWSALGSGLDGHVAALTVFDDGTGPALYAGGNLDQAGGVNAKNIAKWDGVKWSPLALGMNSDVSALTVFDDGTGAALYAGGRFSTAGGVRVNGIARWDGKSWTALGDGLGGRGVQVFTLAGFDDGSGPALYAGGLLAATSPIPFGRTSVAKWDGVAWAAVGALSGGIQYVRSLGIFDAGDGPELYAGGYFASINTVPANNIAKWDGEIWTALDAGIGGTGFSDIVLAMATFDDGAEGSLVVGGRFATSPGRDSNIARWGCVRECSADYDGDGVVDGRDIAAFARDLHRDPGRTDLNGDGRADGRDVRVFVELWAAGCGERSHR